MANEVKQFFPTSEIDNFFSSWCFSASSASILATSAVLTKTSMVCDDPGSDADVKPEASDSAKSSPLSLGSSCT